MHLSAMILIPTGLNAQNGRQSTSFAKQSDEPRSNGVSYQVAATDCLSAPLSMPAIAHSFALDERSLRRPAIHVAVCCGRTGNASPGDAGLAVAAPQCVLAIGEGLKRVIIRALPLAAAPRSTKILVVMVALALAQGIGIYVRFSNIAWVNNRVVNDIGNASMPTC